MITSATPLDTITRTALSIHTTPQPCQWCARHPAEITAPDGAWCCELHQEADLAGTPPTCMARRPRQRHPRRTRRLRMVREPARITRLPTPDQHRRNPPMSTVMDAIAPPAEELLTPPLYYGLIVSKHFDPEALAAEVEDALRFTWPDPDPVHKITETSWALYEPEELLALIEENDRAAAERQTFIDNPDLLGFDAKLINGVVYRNRPCSNCGHVRLMPEDLTLCVPCDAGSHLPDAIVVFDDSDDVNSWIEVEDDPEEDEPYDEHPVTIQVAADITPDELAELIIEHPYIEVWRGMVAATNPLHAGEVWDKAMTIADRITAP